MIGKTISHYKIIEELGSGGMGVVYKTEDTKLKRTVALKFLPPELTRNPESKARFIREAQAASALEHPNICNIHEIGETDDGQMFIVMACYEGKTLKDIVSSQQLAVGKAIDIAIQIAKGLSRAHEEGIIHRDIKPANIIITNRNEVKILDFGLAKLAGQAQLTKETSTLGTVAYMSPEQVSGKKVDQRTDIWSLGVVLYEMLTGELPFKGEYEQAVIYAILKEEPNLLEDIPAELQDIVKKLLMKNPDERYASVAELLNYLAGFRDNYGINRTVQQSHKGTRRKTVIISVVVVFILFAAVTGILFFPASEPEAAIKSLAVLPFSNIKPDPNTDYLGLAFAAEIISDMYYFKNITILPFNSVREITSKEQLNVDYILAGNYIKLEDEMNLNIECFERETDKIIWQESLNRPFKESYGLLSDVSEKVINRLKVQFSKNERQRMEKDIPNNPLAYDYYLRSFSYPLSTEGSTAAINMLNKSIQLDSTFAPALVEIGFHKVRLAQHAFGRSPDYKMAEEYYLKAIRINHELIDALIQLSGMYTDIGNIDKAIKLLDKAKKINPNNAWVPYRLSYIYRYAGMLEESAMEVEKTLSIDRSNPRFGAMQFTYQFMGEYQKALELSNYYISNIFTKQRRGEIYFSLGKLDSSIKYCNRVLEQDPTGWSGTLARSLKAFIDKNTGDGLRALDRWEETNPYDSEIIFILARYYCLYDKREKGLRLLRKAVEGGFFCYPFFLIDPFLDPVRDDPEFQKVLALAKEKHEAFKQKYFTEE